MVFVYRIPPVLGLILAAIVLAAPIVAYHATMNFLAALYWYKPVFLFVTVLLLAGFFASLFIAKEKKWKMAALVAFLVSFALSFYAYADVNKNIRPLEEKIYHMTGIEQPKGKASGFDPLLGFLAGNEDLLTLAQAKSTFYHQQRQFVDPAYQDAHFYKRRSLFRVRPFWTYLDSGMIRTVNFIEGCRVIYKDYSNNGFQSLKDTPECNTFEAVKKNTGMDLDAKLQEDFLESQSCLRELKAGKTESCPTLQYLHANKDHCQKYCTEDDQNPPYSFYLKEKEWNAEGCDYSLYCRSLSKLRLAPLKEAEAVAERNWREYWQKRKENEKEKLRKTND